MQRDDVTFAGAGVRLAGDRWSVAGSSRGTVLLLHGGGQTRGSWRNTGPRIATHGWTPVSIDMRGHGDSEWDPAGDYSVDAFMKDLLAVVAALEERPVIVGASMGGITALLAEGEFGDVARALVLVDIAPRTEPEGIARIMSFMRAHPGGFASLEEVADAVAAYTPNRPRPRNLAGLQRNVRQRDGRWYWHWDPAFLDFGTEELRVANDVRGSQAAARITVPTLLVRGRDSDVVSTDGAEHFLGLIPGARMAEVGAGHMVAGDDNDVFAEQVLSFLDRL